MADIERYHAAVHRFAVHVADQPASKKQQALIFNNEMSSHDTDLVDMHWMYAE